MPCTLPCLLAPSGLCRPSPTAYLSLDNQLHWGLGGSRPPWAWGWKRPEGQGPQSFPPSSPLAPGKGVHMVTLIKSLNCLVLRFPCCTARNLPQALHGSSVDQCWGLGKWHHVCHWPRTTLPLTPFCLAHRPAPLHCPGGGPSSGWGSTWPLPTSLSSFSHLRGRGAGIPWGISNGSSPSLALASSVSLPPVTRKSPLSSHHLLRAFKSFPFPPRPPSQEFLFPALSVFLPSPDRLC